MKTFALVLALGLSSSAVFAQAPAAAPAETAPAAETTVITPDTPAVATRDTGCIRETGTRLRKRDRNGCTGAPGQSYSRDEIDRTGATDTGDAIRRLSPSVSGR